MNRPTPRRAHRRRPRAGCTRLVAALAALATAAVLLPSAGCSSRTSDRDVQVLGVAAARTAVATPTTRLRRPARAAWVDPRTAGDWLTERIPGSLHVPVGSIRDRAEELRGYDVLVVYGRGYKDPVAYAASKVLVEIGVPRVSVLEGGLTAWIAEDGPVASGTPARDETPPPASAS